MSEEKSEIILRDRDIREPLFDWLDEKYGKIRILEEKVIGRVRADVVMVTPGLLYGIEIKSDADTYARLARQVRYYNWYYDRNIIVIGSKHAHHVKEHVPEWWGIISVEADEKGRSDFYEVRQAAENPRVKDHRKIAILWRRELTALLQRNHLPKYAGKSKDFVRKKLLDTVPSELLWQQACEELFERDYSIFDEEG
ncbi:MAG: sce7726 family protein [Lachnospiraceae bacterium]|nr:sce7726 family protein [Lachnospiraceae bacterium]